MPIIFQEQLHPEGELGIWEIAEQETWFRSRLDLYREEREQLDRIKGRRRRLEWLAARELMHQMSGRADRGAFVKDPFGKPHLEGTDWSIAISHSRDFAAAIAAPVSVGIDIQVMVEKIDRLTPRFMRPEEVASLHPASRLPHLHVYWGAKESLYKAYGMGALDFCTNIVVEPFGYRPEGGEIRGAIRKKGEERPYRLWYRRMASHILVYAMEEDRS